MVQLIFHGLYLFFFVLEFILCISIISSWIPGFKQWKSILSEFLEPMLLPIQFCLRHSVFQVKTIDLSPLLALIILSYLQTFFYQLIK
ncbi:YggT family protein [Velocimicrobium porci]|uniref:YggT family protein n=1 Tax=Velocimicrobium porci TaxID=2606634 RepID=A0A6L5Y201_9FIRM|nr:hypothetical protein [Velocimicrobium porci]